MLERNSRISVLNAIIGAVSLNMINPYIGILAIRLGADNLQLGYLSSWANALSVVAVLGGAAAVARARHKQRVIAGMLLIGRIAALGVAIVPWLPEQTRVWALIGFWVLFVFPGSAGGTAMQSFLADVFPDRDRARELAARQSWAIAAGMVVAFGTGWLLDNVLPYPGGYSIMFAGSFVVALYEIVLFLRLKEHPGSQPSGTGAGTQQRLSLRAYRKVFTHRPYAIFAGCSVLFHFTWQLAWPMFTRFQVTDMQADNTWLSLVQVANSLASVLTFPIWARLADRYGNRKLMPLAALWLAAAPVLVSLAPNVQWLVVINLFTGIGVAGVMLLILNNLFDVSPAKGRPLFVATHAAMVSISATVAPMAGAFLISVMPTRSGLYVATAARLLSAIVFLVVFTLGHGGQGNRGTAENESELEPVS